VIWPLAFSVLLLVAGVLVWRQCLKLAPMAQQALTAQADAMVRERHAAELNQIAAARFQTAHALLETVRRDRDLMLAAARNPSAAADVDRDRALSREDREMLEALRGYHAVLVGTCTEHRWVILVGDDFPVEHFFPGAQKGVTQ